MKSYSTAIISAVVTFGAVFFGFYLNHEKVDIRYTLSENIPVSIIGQKSSESIQQLDIKNIGNKEATKLVITINGQINKYELIKNSLADSIQEFKTNNNIELIYPSLPPEGSIKIILNTSGEGLKTNDILISHNSGRGTEALKKTNITGYFSFFFLVFYLVAMLWAYKTLMTDSWETKAKYSRQDEVLKKKHRPIYISDEKWKAIYEEAIDKKVNKSRYIGFHNISDNEVYKLLSYEKPNYLSEEDWNKILSNAVELLSTAVTKLLSEFDSPTILLELIKIKQPLNFPPQKWDELQGKIQKKYISLKKLDYSDHLYNISYFDRELKQSKPQEIEDNYWQDYINFLKREYYYQISRQIEFESRPFEFLKSLDLTLLEHKDKEILENNAYRAEIRKIFTVLDITEAEKFLNNERPTWINDTDYHNLKEFAKKVLELDKLLKNNKKIFSTLENIINNENIPQSKPEILDLERWEQLVRLSTEFKKAFDDRAHITSLMTKIEKQLSIINSLLEDPDVLDRIEDYNNPFAPGNFANLKKIAKLMKDIG